MEGDIAREWSLADESFWYPIKSVLSRAAEVWQRSPAQIASVLQAAIRSGSISMRVPMNAERTLFNIVSNPRMFEMLQKVGLFDRIDWFSGTLKNVDGSDCNPAGFAIEVYWPEVQDAISRSLQAPNASSVAQTSKGGRPTKYDWPGFDAWLADYLNENGAPAERGGQANLERKSAKWFGDECPAPSEIRKRVTTAIAARAKRLA